MKKEKILDHCIAQQELYRDIFGIVSKFEKKKIYRITYAYYSFLEDEDGNMVRDDKGNWTRILKHATVIGQVIAFNSESIRVKVLAGDKNTGKWGYDRGFKEEKDERGYRQDTTSIKYEMLTLQGSEIVPIDDDDMLDELMTHVGCEFVHSDFKKHLEAA